MRKIGALILLAVLPALPLVACGDEEGVEGDAPGAMSPAAMSTPTSQPRPSIAIATATAIPSPVPSPTPVPAPVVCAGIFGEECSGAVALRVPGPGFGSVAVGMNVVAGTPILSPVPGFASTSVGEPFGVHRSVSVVDDYCRLVTGAEVSMVIVRTGGSLAPSDSFQVDFATGSAFGIVAPGELLGEVSDPAPYADTLPFNVIVAGDEELLRAAFPNAFAAGIRDIDMVPAPVVEFGPGVYLDTDGHPFRLGTGEKCP